MMDDLKVEASHLLKLQHPSLIRLYGIVRQPAMMVFELCEGGSLLDRLRDDKKPILLVSRLHDYCIQIAKALQFLESKHCVHRDVAARNILLSKDEKIFTFGEAPWVGCRAIDVLKNIDAGERLEKPKYCSERIYGIMKDCWKSNPTERCKFGAIREDLKDSMFVDAIARETYHSIQPGTLQLVKGDEVVVVENIGQDWFGQNKKNLQFGTFPRSAVFAQTNHAVATASAVPPQKVPTAPTIKVQQTIQPTVVPISQKPLNDRTSRISMPVAGSFIHTGHGDPLGGQSWGNPSTIDDLYLKTPVTGAPLSSMSNGAQIIASKELLTKRAAPSTAAKVRGLSLDLPEYDDFDRAFDYGFSPSKIELPRAGSGNDSIISNGSSSFRAEDVIIEAPKPKEPSFDIRGNVLRPTPIEKEQAPSTSQPNLFALSDKLISSQPRADVAINHQSRPISAVINPVILTHSAHLIPELQHRLNAGNDMMRPRPASLIGIQNNALDNFNPHRPFSVVNVPTIQNPAPILSHSTTSVLKASTSQQQNPLQKALTDELKGNLSRRPTSAGYNGNGFQRNGVNRRSQSISQPPRVLPANQASNISQPVRLPPPTTSVIPPAQSVNSRPAATSVTTATSSTANGTSSSQNVVTRRTTRTVQMSEEERRSKIIQDVTSALPAPSALLYGSSSTSALPSSASQVERERPHVTMPPKKTSEPILSSAVLQPTRLPSATTSVVKPASQPAPQPVIDNRQYVITNKKPNMPSYPNYGNGYQPYGYGMHYNPGYSGYTGYSPYLSTANSLPPLVPSENRHSGTAQPLDDAAIMEFLGSQHHRQPAAHTTPQPAQASQAPTQSSSRNNELSMKMKVLYKEADFTDSGNCDTMVMHCKGDTELALKLLKQNHLVQIGLARDTNRARQALESRQYDLTAAANLLLG
ncbi:hypothetical protein CAEBREN_13561 [Caenorhabditis brenneri]|uniref:non-specific protein-tyrosine kinase n=1 Tax=Caenorhabditis brenneri TaxID=135651 RepID=G0PLA6_CAEBE|nr:hypothetical protein CAEBREN_13561 [Caenorhabditis brenneri]